MLKIISIAVFSVGLATAAMAHGGSAGGMGGGADGAGTHANVKLCKDSSAKACQ